MEKQNLQCPFCPATSSHGAGLASHIRSAHPRAGARKVAAVQHAATVQRIKAGGFSGIVAGLERQRAAIESALAALRGVGSTAGPEVKRKRGRPRKVAVNA